MPDKPILRPTASPAPRLDQFDVYALCHAERGGPPMAIVGTEQAAEDWLRIYNMNRDEQEQAMWIGYNLDGR